MHIVSVVLLACALATDAASIAVCKGLAAPRLRLTEGGRMALFFGLFQMGMPLIGWLIGSSVSALVAGYSHWISFALLAFIGGKMIFEAVNSESAPVCSGTVSLRELILLSIATSIDALAVGLTFALQISSFPSVFFSCTLIGVITAALSFLGYLLGQKLGGFFRGKAEIVGGVVLILIGLKLLLEKLL